MKKLWFIALVVASWFIYTDRMRLFMRDPMGAVTRNGTFEDGAHVYINYDNDVLLENGNLPRYLLVVQHGQPVGVPAPVNCLFMVLCLTSAYPAPQIAPLTGAPADSMTNKQVTFKDENGRDVLVKLR